MILSRVRDTEDGEAVPHERSAVSAEPGVARPFALQTVTPTQTFRRTNMPTENKSEIVIFKTSGNKASVDVCFEGETCRSL